MRIEKIIFSILIICLVFVALSWKIRSEENDKPKAVSTVSFKDKFPVTFDFNDQINFTYQQSGLDSSDLSFEVFRKAYIGFLNLQVSGKVPQDAGILSIADFSQSSRKKRLWILDLHKNEVLLNTWVSHGRGSGADVATKFSNIHSSYQSSLGFYITGEVYVGKHGRSLRLDGMDSGFNNRARERAIVMHGASYVSAQAIKSLNRLGLSHGCPAVPLELSDQIIDLVKEKTVLYIHGNSTAYSSKYMDEELAKKTVLASFIEKTTPSSYYGSL